MRKITTGRYEFKGYIYCLCTMRTKWYSLGNFSSMYFCINRLTTDTPLNGPTCYQEGPKTPLANISIYPQLIKKVVFTLQTDATHAPWVS